MLRHLFLAALLAAAPALAADPPKVFRYAFEVAETSFDPHFVSDVYSNIVNQGMYEPPVTYDYLARPLKMKPLTAASLPEVSADATTYTVRIKPGIYFADDPAFKGKKRELVAEDYVYSMKRLLDPKVRASQIAALEPYVLGADKAAAQARKDGKLDYDAPVEGLKVLDRYTFQVKLNQPLYVFIYNFSDCHHLRRGARGGRALRQRLRRPSGGHRAWKLAFWKRSSKMVFERNPNFREELFDGEPAADDKRGQEILAKFKAAGCR